MIFQRIKSIIKRVLPPALLNLYRSYRWSNTISLLQFLFKHYLGIPFKEKLFIIKQMIIISNNVHCPHTHQEMVSVIESILSIPKHINGCIVEAGSYKGGSAAKLSIACNIMNRQLVLFDSFEGIPENDEFMANGKLYHTPGSWYGTIEEVKNNIKEYGALEVCEFIKGWFDDTIQDFNKPVLLMFLDVNLASSTRICLRYLYPLLVPGGVIYSHDGDLPLVINVYEDNDFWQKEIGYPKPFIEGLRKNKLIRIVKPINGQNDYYR